MAREITKIIIHCSATPADMDVGAETIRKWHTDPKPKGNGWADIGYHYVIRRDGKVEKGRAESVKGAHCAAKNGNIASLGICMVGGVKRVNGKLLTENNFTPAQWSALKTLVLDIIGRYKIDVILGHRDLDPGKDCPSFSVRDWILREHIRDSHWK